MPAISVLLCNYNHGRYLRKCLAGLLRQTFKDFEIVITDDGSTDGSQEIIRDQAARDTRFVPKYFETNRGVLAATDDVCQRAQGTYLLGQGADDFIIDDRYFERAISALRAEPQAAGFYGVSAIFSDEKNQPTGMMGSAPKEGFLPPTEFLQGFLRGEIFVPGSASIWKASAFRGFGGYDVSFGPQTDFYINHGLPCQQGIIFAKAVFTCMRVYESAVNYGSKTTVWESAQRYAEVEKRIRSFATSYDGMETDWKVWRARWMLDAIEKSGVKIR